MDLDQAVHIERAGDGYTVHYAIADVAAFVQPGDPIDLEARKRGETLYAPDKRTPLHPPELSEGAASLLPDEVRPALLWTIAVDSAGEGTDVDCTPRAGEVARQAELRRRAEGPRRRYSVASRCSCSARSASSANSANSSAAASTCRSPTRRSSPPNGDWTLEFRAPLPVEGWNAQISLLTGMAAAHLMMYGEIGILRTLPDSQDDLRRKPGEHREGARHRVARRDVRTRQFIHGLDPKVPAHAAMLAACTVLFRGAGYTSFSGGVPEQPEHAAMKSEYAHVTAPLRRLVDRWTGEICVALCADARGAGVDPRVDGRDPQDHGRVRPQGERLRTLDRQHGRGRPGRRPGRLGASTA